MKKINKKIIMITLICALLIIGSIIVYFKVSYSISDDNTTNKCLKSSLGDSNSKELELIGMQRLTDEQGLLIEPLKFTVSNICSFAKEIKFDVKLNRITNIAVDRVKVALNNDIYQLTTMPESSKSNYGEKLYTIKTINIDPKETIEFEYRNWEEFVTTKGDFSERTVATTIIINE